MFSNLLVGVRTLLLRALKNRSIHHSQNTKILLERKREGEKKNIVHFHHELRLNSREKEKKKRKKSRLIYPYRIYKLSLLPRR